MPEADNAGVHFSRVRDRAAVRQVLAQFGSYAGYREAVAGRPFDPDWGTRWKTGDDLERAQKYYETARQFGLHALAAGLAVAWRDPKAIPARLIDIGLLYAQGRLHGRR